MIDPRLFVTIEEMPGNTIGLARPLSSGFSLSKAYRVLGSHVTDMTAEYGVWLANDQDKLYLISNRDLRVHHLELDDGEHAGKHDDFRIDLH